MENNNKVAPISNNSNVILPIPCQGIRDVLTCGKPQVSAIVRAYGAQVVHSAIMGLIVGVCENISVGKTMTANQIKFAGEALADKFWYLKLEDFALCFKRGVMGDYGKLYDRMDVQVLVEWLKQYEEERNMECHKLQRDKGIENSTQFWGAFSDGQVDTLKKTMIEKRAQVEEQPALKMDLTEFELQMVAEYDALPDAQGGMRIYNDQPIALHEYAVMRAKEISSK